MNTQLLVQSLIDETTQTSLSCFAPELALCATVVVLLLVRLFNLDRGVPTWMYAMVGAVVAGGLTCLQYLEIKHTQGDVFETFFTGLLVFDQFTVFFRLFLLLFLIFVIALTVLSGIPDNEDGPDFYTLLLGSTIGMMLMVSANHLLILFLGVEMTSVPSYVMVGFLKGRRTSSEAALKYVVYGAGAAGVMLYGISLLAGLLGTGTLLDPNGAPVLAERFDLLVAGQAATGISSPLMRIVVLGILFVMVGLAFKLSVVPFHFWCPDAFEGASAEVAGFLSVASKAAAFGLLVRFCLAFAGGEMEAIRELQLSMGIGLGVIAAITATFGNLAAYAQTNMKRLLAYSTIAHAGYMLMAIAALLVVLGDPGNSGGAGRQAVRCIEGLLYYLFVYLFMNLGAFAVVALIRNHIYSEEIDDYAGLARETPAACVCMLVCLFSLIGMPPFGGFFAKMMIFVSVFEAGAVHWSMWIVLVIAGVNTVFSLFYYMRVLQAMFLADRPDGRPSVELSFGSLPAGYLLTVCIPILLLGMSPLMSVISSAAQDVASVVIR